MSDVLTATPPPVPKTVLREALDRMPDSASYAEIIEELRILAALEESAQEIRDGKGVPQAEAKARTARWLSR